MQVVQLGHSARAVDRHVGLEADLFTASRAAHHEVSGGRLDAADLDVQLHLDPEIARTLHQHGDQVGIEGLERPAPRWRIVTRTPARAAMWANSNDT